MNENTPGLSRALKKGDSVIMSSGATATARSAYPAGYAGDVDLLLDGQEIADEAESLVLPGADDAQEILREPESPIVGDSNRGEVRGRSHRMED